MAVTFDSVGAGSVAQGAVTTLTTTWLHTISASGPNTCVVVPMAFWYAGFTSMTASYGGNAMTELAHIDDSSIGLRIAMFYLFNPPTGAKTVSITGNDTSTAQTSVSGNSVAYQGVGAIISGGTNSGTGATTTITIASAVGEFVIASSVAFASVQASPNHTQRYDDATGNTNQMIQDAAGAASLTFTATATSGKYDAIAARLQPAFIAPRPLVVVGQSVKRAGIY